MKRYIRATVKETITLKDWIDQNEDVLDPKTPLQIYNITPRLFGDSNHRYNLWFDGTFQGLCIGSVSHPGKNDFIPEYEDYDLEDYLNKFNRYPIDEIIHLNNGGYQIIIIT
jgi:hypothetical protein